MDDHSLQLRVIYEDLPDLIGLGIRVRHGDWSAASTAYTSPEFLREDAKRIIDWSRSPSKPLRLEAGADTGIGWLVLEFYTIDAAGHARCVITLATRASTNARPAESWRFSIELATELGLVERFGHECLALGEDFTREAILVGLPA